MLQIVHLLTVDCLYPYIKTPSCKVQHLLLHFKGTFNIPWCSYICGYLYSSLFVTGLTGKSFSSQLPSILRIVIFQFWYSCKTDSCGFKYTIPLLPSITIVSPSQLSGYIHQSNYSRYLQRTSHYGSMKVSPPYLLQKELYLCPFEQYLKVLISRYDNNFSAKFDCL